ncbi:MAG: MarR family transcriptional regulator [Rhodospirillales bacterium]|nr:MarR family transcriptional regulator [Rhodospirillales bacterium]
MTPPDGSGVARTRRRQADKAPSPPTGAGERAIDMGGLPDFIGYALRRAQIRVFEDFIRSLAKLDVSPAQFSVLLVIDRNPGLKQSQVSAVLGIQRTNFVAMVDELERRGLVVRQAVPNDRRSHALVLTDHGRENLRKAAKLQAKHERRLGERLGEGGREALLRLLRALAST